MSLLDDLVDDHQKKTTDEEKEAAAEKLEAARRARAREARQAASEKAAGAVATTPQRWARDPDAQIAGFVPGDRFEMRDCGPDLDGVWEVVGVESRPTTPGEARHLVAARPEGGPPYAKIAEADVQAEIDCGRLVALKDRG